MVLSILNEKQPVILATACALERMTRPAVCKPGQRPACGQARKKGKGLECDADVHLPDADVVIIIVVVRSDV